LLLGEDLREGFIKSDIVTRWGYAMALIEVYFDESGTHHGATFMCVAGYIFEKNKALQLEIEWGKMLVKYGLPYFHMSECAHNKGIYKHLNKTECDLAAREAIALTKAHAAQGIAVSIESGCYELLPPNVIWDDSYAWLSCQVLFGVYKWAESTGYNGDIAYFYEAGAHGQGKVSNAMLKISKDLIAKINFRLGSYTLIEKDSAAALQCADLLAWHWYTHNRRKQQGDKIRKDFKSLIELKNVDVHHYDKVAIEKWLNWMRAADQ
jgi:hypothetical protein